MLDSERIDYMTDEIKELQAEVGRLREEIAVWAQYDKANGEEIRRLEAEVKTWKERALAAEAWAAKGATP